MRVGAQGHAGLGVVPARAGVLLAGQRHPRDALGTIVSTSDQRWEVPGGHSGVVDGGGVGLVTPGGVVPPGEYGPAWSP